MLRTGWIVEERAKKTAMQEEHTTSSKFQDLKQLIQAQQQMLDEVEQRQTQSQHIPTRGTA